VDDNIIKKKEKIATIISNDGEIINELASGDRIVRGNSIECLSMTQEWKIESFYKGHIGEIRKVLSEFSTTERAFLFSIATYIGYEDCCLKYDNGNELNFDDIVEICGMSRGQTSNTVNSLIKKDIIYKGKNSKQRQYFVNPWLYCKGNRINKVLKTMFTNYKIRILGGKKWKDVR
jgi:hypothetical protein